MGILLSTLVFQPPAHKTYKLTDAHLCIETDRESTIVARHIDKGYDRTVLFSHGNAEDIGPTCTYFQRFVCDIIQANVFIYEYTGYGHSKGGPPCEESIYSDIRAAYNYLTKVLRVPSSSIILYGRSLGCCATVDLASKLSDPVGGIVLQSPMLSVLRIGFYFRFTLVRVCDHFDNLSKAHLLRAPVLIIHGTNDDVIPFWHAQELLRRVPIAATPLWLDAGHNDIELKHSSVLFKHMANFVESSYIPDAYDPLNRLKESDKLKRYASTREVLPGGGRGVAPPHGSTSPILSRKHAFLSLQSLVTKGSTTSKGSINSTSDSSFRGSFAFTGAAPTSGRRRAVNARFAAQRQKSLPVSAVVYSGSRLLSDSDDSDDAVNEKSLPVSAVVYSGSRLLPDSDDAVNEYYTSISSRPPSRLSRGRGGATSSAKNSVPVLSRGGGGGGGSSSRRQQMIDTHARNGTRSRTRSRFGGSRARASASSSSLSPSASEPLLDGAGFSPPSTTDFAEAGSSRAHDAGGLATRPATSTAKSPPNPAGKNGGGDGDGDGYLTLGNTAHHRFLSEDSGRTLAQSPKDSTVFTEFSSFSESTFHMSDNNAVAAAPGHAGDNGDMSRLRSSFFQASAGCSTDVKKRHSFSDMAAEPMLRGVKSS